MIDRGNKKLNLIDLVVSLVLSSAYFLFFFRVTNSYFFTLRTSGNRNQFEEILIPLLPLLISIYVGYILLKLVRSTKGSKIFLPVIIAFLPLFILASVINYFVVFYSPGGWLISPSQTAMLEAIFNIVLTIIYLVGTTIFLKVYRRFTIRA